MSSAATARAEIATAVRNARVAAGMTRTAVAARAHVDPLAVWRVESGRSLPRPGLVRSLARALRADPKPWLAIVADGHAEISRASVARLAAARPRANDAIRAAYIAKADTARSRVTAERVAFGLTGTELARRADVFPSQVAALETGRFAPRDADTGDWRSVAVAVAAALGSTPAELWPEHALRAPRLPRPAPPARPDDLYLAAETNARLRGAIAQLPPRSAAVLALRFGLPCGPRVLPGAAVVANATADCGGMHLRDVGALLGVSGERVRQLEHEALGRIAHLLGDLRP